MTFRYHKDATKQGKILIWWGMSCLVTGIALGIFLYNWEFVLFEPTLDIHWINEAMASIVFLAVSLGAAVFIIVGLRLKNTAGQWDIQITEDKIVWKSPNEEIEANQCTDMLLKCHDIWSKP